ncbi:MAG: DinB family protein [Chloroflexi bacterium]|nr:DinB family protein [Chloroflexota bacterium]
MNTHDVLMYGHQWVHKHLEGLSDEQWLTPNVCGVWSVKDIIAHLASFEYLLSDVFESCIHPVETPTLDLFRKMDGDAFNADQVGRRKHLTSQQTLQEYNNAYEQVMNHLKKIGENDLRQTGTIPWYGNEYSLEDLVVYQYYGHKREHCAQIAIFRDTLK